MKYFQGDYFYTTLILLTSSFCFVLALGNKDWSVAIWAFNTWFVTMQFRALIRAFNNKDVIKQAYEENVLETKDGSNHDT